MYSYDHIHSFADAFTVVHEEDLGNFDCADNIITVDETAVTAKFWKLENLFGGANSHHGGFWAAVGSGSRKYVPAYNFYFCIPKRAPPFLDQAGKHIMKNRARPLTKSEVKRHPELEWHCVENWCPGDSVTMTSENGSMENRLILF